MSCLRMMKLYLPSPRPSRVRCLNLMVMSLVGEITPQKRVYNTTLIPLHLMGVVVFSSEGVVFGNCVESHFVRVTASSWKST